MPEQPQQNSQAWTAFTMASFAIAAAMMAVGIYRLEASFSAKGFYAMAAIMLVHTTVALTKTLRDREEADKFRTRVDDARTERPLLDSGSRDETHNPS